MLFLQAPSAAAAAVVAPGCPGQAELAAQRKTSDTRGRAACAETSLWGAAMHSLSSTRQFVLRDKEKKRKLGKRGGYSSFFFQGVLLPRAAQLSLLGTLSHVWNPCRSLSFAVPLGHQSRAGSNETSKASRHSTQLRFECFRAGRSFNKASWGS